uniref:F-box domain-containing protein n=2 Tax=Brassica oleracea var. oleracea TaxID=109376 RepID=A0A0D3D1S4_BRAOL
MMPRMCDLGEKLVVEIFKRVPITSLKAVRSTCKTWEAITKSWVVLGKKAADEFLLGFVKMNNKVYSLRYHQGDVSVQQVDLLNQLEISAVYHCDGLVLCVAKDLLKLVVWNPYLCQSRWIGPRGESFEASDIYAIGYSEDKNKKRDHKILRLVDDNCVAGPVLNVFRCEIYEMSSSDSSWRVLEEAKPKWEIDVHQRGASVNGNTYFFAHDRVDDIEPDADGSIPVDGVEDFLLCFDFTKERFGPRLPLPFHSFNEDCVTLSSFLRGDGDDEQLAALFGGCESSFFEIWLTLTLVEPDHVSWTKFLLVETGGPIFTSLHFQLSTYFGGSFFVDEENKVAVVFELDSYISISAPPPSQHTAFVFGQAGYIQSVNLGQALKLQHLSRYSGKHCQALLPPLVCSSSFRPTLVQVS